MSMRLSSYAICGTGLVRSENQDNLYVNGAYREDILDNSPFRYADIIEKHGLYVVADGMGGESHGALASLVAVQAIRSANLSGGHKGMVAYLVERNAIICNMIMMNDGARIGSTFVSLNIIGDCAELTNLGDSRAYMLRDGKFTRLSHDHTPTQQMMDHGILTEDEARAHPDRHRLVQHLGVFPDEMRIEPYTTSVVCEAGDIFLLCSDGLADMLTDAEIKKVLDSSGTIEQGAEVLFGEAIRSGGKDNITIIMVQAKRGGIFR